MKVDIVIPVYNKRNYVIECLESVRRQTVQGINTIIVNDGSTDDSGKVINDYLKKYPYFKATCYNKMNGGLGSARNYGLKYVKSEYVFFLDPDDFLPVDAIEKLLDAARGMDIVVGRYQYLFDDNHIENQSISSFDRFNCKHANTGVFYKYFFEERYGINACNKIYKSSFLQASGILFQDNHVIYAEDLLFNAKLMEFDPKIRVISDITYIYRQNDSSITHNYQKQMSKRFANLVCDYFGERKGKREMLPIIMVHALNCIGGQENKFKGVKQELTVFKAHTNFILSDINVKNVRQITTFSHRIDHIINLFLYKYSIFLLAVFQNLKNKFLR